MRWTEKQLGGWSLLVGAAAVAVGYALSPGRRIGLLAMAIALVLWR